MTDTAKEMVTISYEVSVAHAQAEAREVGLDEYTGHDRAKAIACEAALDARKSPYDRWRETLFLPWERQPGNSATVTDPRFSVRPGIHSSSSHSDELDQLMAAAPGMLVALVAIIAWRQWLVPAPEIWAAARDAIRAAVPADVADYLLADGTK